MKQLDQPVLSAILSNLSKAAEKQDRFDDAAMFEKLSGEFLSTGASANEGGLDALTAEKADVEKDLSERYPAIGRLADAIPDSGAQRCVKWGEKVSSIQKSLLSRYDSKGEALLEGKNLYICEACGFIALADQVPELCPVCKAPKSRFSKLQ